MMLSSSPNTHPDGPLQLSLDPDPALNILSNEMEKSNCIHHYLPLIFYIKILSTREGLQILQICEDYSSREIAGNS